MELLILLFWTSGDVYPAFKSRVDSLACVLGCLSSMIPQIYLWCDTCRPVDGQHGSQACHSVTPGTITKPFTDPLILVFRTLDGNTFHHSGWSSWSLVLQQFYIWTMLSQFWFSEKRSDYWSSCSLTLSKGPFLSDSLFFPDWVS